MIMIKSKYILSFLLLINNSIGFIFPVKYNSIVCKTPQINNNMLIMHNMHMKNNDNDNDKKNTSKIYKIVFSNEDELEQLYKPKYMFGLSEFNLIFIRIIVYYIITIYFIVLIIQKNK
jgi:hypothetical protein